MLSRFRFKLVRPSDIRNESNMYIHTIIVSDLVAYLSYSLDKRIRFHIPDRSAYFRDNNIGISIIGNAVNSVFNFVRYMRYYLNGMSKIIASSLLIYNRHENFTGSNVAADIETFVYKSFVMSQIKIGFRPVVGYKNLTVLIRAHSSRIIVNIRVKFLNGNLITAVFKQSPERRGGNSFSEAGHDSSRNKNKLRLHNNFSFLYLLDHLVLYFLYLL